MVADFICVNTSGESFVLKFASTFASESMSWRGIRPASAKAFAEVMARLSAKRLHQIPCRVIMIDNV